MKLITYSYDLKDNLIDFKTGDSITNYLKEYGFISQEIKKNLKGIDITATDNGVLLMDYDQIIPITVSAIKEQQIIIDSLRNQLANLKEMIENFSILASDNLDYDNELNLNKSILYQNKPNPFNKKTIIEYRIKENNFSSASIVIFNMNGTLLKTYSITTVNENEISLNAQDLNAGMYIYTLIVNDKEVDTKRMILLK